MAEFGGKSRWQELNRRGLSEGWAVFDSSARGLEIERIDDRDPQLADDGDAIKLARAAGVDCNDDGTLTEHEARLFCQESKAVFE